MASKEGRDKKIKDTDLEFTNLFNAHHIFCEKSTRECVHLMSVINKNPYKHMQECDSCVQKEKRRSAEGL